MIVKCTRKKLAKDLSKDLTLSGWTNAEGYLTIGKMYVVYGIYRKNNINYYLICDDYYNGLDYPYPLYIPSAYFQVIDNTSPEMWKIKKTKTELIIGMPPLTDWAFYDKLTDWDKEAVTIFNIIKKQIDVESCLDSHHSKQ